MARSLFGLPLLPLGLGAGVVTALLLTRKSLPESCLIRRGRATALMQMALQNPRGADPFAMENLARELDACVSVDPEAPAAAAALRQGAQAVRAAQGNLPLPLPAGPAPGGAAPVPPPGPGPGPGPAVPNAPNVPMNPNQAVVDEGRQLILRAQNPQSSMVRPDRMEQIADQLAAAGFTDDARLLRDEALKARRQRDPMPCQVGPCPYGPVVRGDVGDPQAPFDPNVCNPKSAVLPAATLERVNRLSNTTNPADAAEIRKLVADLEPCGFLTVRGRLQQKLRELGVA